jgi:hypothetical protein
LQGRTVRPNQGISSLFKAIQSNSNQKITPRMGFVGRSVRPNQAYSSLFKAIFETQLAAGTKKPADGRVRSLTSQEVVTSPLLLMAPLRVTLLQGCRGRGVFSIPEPSCCGSGWIGPTMTWHKLSCHTGMERMLIHYPKPIQRLHQGAVVAPNRGESR